MDPTPTPDLFAALPPALVLLWLIWRTQRLHERDIE